MMSAPGKQQSRPKTCYQTLVTRDYLARSLCLFQSIESFLDDAIFAIYCMDEESAAVLETLVPSCVRIFREADFVPRCVAEQKEIRVGEYPRGFREYVLTCKPVIIQHAMTILPSIEWSVFMDADMYCFANPAAAIESQTESFGILTQHHWSSAFAHWAEKGGDHNSGYAAFRNCRESVSALNWWLEQTLDRPGFEERGKETFEQKIVDKLPLRFPGIVDARAKGLNAGPWNIENYKVAAKNDEIYLDGELLYVFHYQGLKTYSPKIHDLYTGPHRLPSEVVRAIYRPYLRTLKDAHEVLRTRWPGLNAGTVPVTQWPKPIYHQIRRKLAGTNNLALA